MRDSIQETARQWRASRDVIVGFLRELRPDMTQEQHEHNAAAIIARLANHEPPILMAYEEELKD